MEHWLTVIMWNKFVSIKILLRSLKVSLVPQKSPSDAHPRHWKGRKSHFELRKVRNCFLVQIYACSQPSNSLWYSLMGWIIQKKHENCILSRSSESAWNWGWFLMVRNPYIIPFPFFLDFIWSMILKVMKSLWWKRGGKFYWKN